MVLWVYPKIHRLVCDITTHNSLQTFGKDSKTLHIVVLALATPANSAANRYESVSFWLLTQLAEVVAWRLTSQQLP